MRRTWLAVVALGGVLGLVGASEAVTLTWNTCKDGTDANQTCQPGDLVPSARTGTLGGTGALTFDAIGDPTKQLVVRAYRTATNVGTGLISVREINLFEGGLGAGAEGSPEHAVDNVGVDELLVFQFGSDAYIPKSFRIGYKNEDADIVAYIGGTLGGPGDVFALFAGGFTWDATGGLLTSSLGFRREVFPLDPDSSSVPVGVDVVFNSVNANPAGQASGRYLILGARNEASCSGTCEGGEDKFKLQQVVGELPAQVPEPSTLAFVGLGLGALAALGRRSAP